MDEPTWNVFDYPLFFDFFDVEWWRNACTHIRDFFYDDIADELSNRRLTNREHALRPPPPPPPDTQYMHKTIRHTIIYEPYTFHYNIQDLQKISTVSEIGCN